MCNAQNMASYGSIIMGKRPPHVKPPAYLSKSPPVPAPDPLGAEPRITEELSPTRYGDWERKGVAVDF
tara:strand:- start:2242 stop:2445 length:204 start_codon:yes stop_codon:yes gene_type:complete